MSEPSTDVATELNTLVPSEQPGWCLCNRLDHGDDGVGSKQQSSQRLHHGAGFGSRLCKSPSWNLVAAGATVVTTGWAPHGSCRLDETGFMIQSRTSTPES